LGTINVQEQNAPEKPPFLYFYDINLGWLKSIDLLIVKALFDVLHKKQTFYILRAILLIEVKACQGPSLLASASSRPPFVCFRDFVGHVRRDTKLRRARWTVCPSPAN
jgi:hypothetical protein